jgi:hypothetical protein
MPLQLGHCLSSTAACGESNEDEHRDDRDLLSTKYVTQLRPDDEQALTSKLAKPISVPAKTLTSISDQVSCDNPTHLAEATQVIGN